MHSISTATGYIVGLDLGDRADYTALTVVRQHRTPTGHWREIATGYGLVRAEAESEFTYDVLHLDRWRGHGYKAALPRVQAVLTRLAHLTYEERRKAGLANQPELPAFVVVDQTGLGRPVLEDLRASGLPDAVGITFTAGHQVNRDGHDYLVPKTMLVSSLRVAVENGRIATAPVPLRPVLETELQNLRRKVRLATGYEAIEAGTDWREEAHDDLVFSLAMAVWFGEQNPVGQRERMEVMVNAWAAEM